MAGNSRKKDLQETHSTTALNYGHLGFASYNDSARRWTFLRQPVAQGHPSPAFPFNLVKQETVYPAVGTSSPTLDHFKSDSDVSYHKRRGRIAGLGPVPRSVLQEESLSDAITISEAQYTANMSDRLALGGASVLLDNDVRSGQIAVPVAAFASGTTGENIVLVQLGRDTVSVNHASNKKVYLQVPKITTTNATTWRSSGEPVQQICFAATTGQPSTWMAARLLTSTTIFHPLLHRRAPNLRPTGNALPFTESSSAPLDANPVLTIPISRTGGHQHADIRFHPGDCHLFAMVDQHGNWSTWQVEGKRPLTARVLFRVHLLKSGKLYSWEGSRKPAGIPPYHDGWHRVCWLANSSGIFDRIFIVNRRDAKLQMIADEKSHGVDLRLGQFKEARWVLDIRASVTRPERIYVLTSTHVLYISTSAEDWRNSLDDDGPIILCSWRHFRGGEDITLRLTVLETSHCAAILLSSQANLIINTYQLRTSSEDLSIPMSWYEPLLLSAPQVFGQSEMQRATHYPSTIVFAPLQVQYTSKAGLLAPNYSLHKFVMLNTNCSITETLLASSSTELCTSVDSNDGNVIPLPPKRNLPNASSKYAEIEELEDFIVADNQDLPKLQLPEQHMQLRSGHRGVEVADRRLETDWEDILDMVTKGSAGPLSTEKVVLTEHFQDIYIKSQPASRGLGVRLLSDLLVPLPHIDDIEEYSASISSLLQYSGVIGHGPPSYHGLHFASNILGLYQSFVSHWLSPLPSHVPDRIRVNKERLSRVIAADVAFSAIAVRPAAWEAKELSIQEGVDPNSAPQAKLSTTSDRALDLSLAPLALSQPILSEPAISHEHPACTRLRACTTIAKNAVTASTSQSLSDMLAHLPADANMDPSTYDWRSVEAITSGSTEGETIDPRVRRRAEKRARLRERRTLQNKAAGDGNQQQAAPIIGSSQMILPGREVQSSQVRVPEEHIFGDHRPMTQPERGAFGTRMGGKGSARKDRGKKRVAGF